MPKTKQEKLLEYARKKAEGMERIRQNAQSAYIRAQEEKNKGNIKASIQWMDRAHRLALRNPNITFDLAMLYLKQKQHDQAYTLLNPLMGKFDFYEGWLALALVIATKKDFDRLLTILEHALSHHCPVLETWPLVINLTKKLQMNGCCGLVGSMGQAWISTFKPGSVSLFLDDNYLGETNNKYFNLPEGWQDCQDLHVQQDGVSLLGSPIDIQSICRTEGFVEIDQGHMSGWLWYPAEPERLPVLSFYNSKNILEKQITVQDYFEIAHLDVPLFRAKCFKLPLEDFSPELYAVKDEQQRNLIGSPIDPWILIPKQKKLRSITKKHQLCVPVSAFFYGEKPQIASKKAMGLVIIVPVYKGIEETIACVEAVLQTVPDDVIIQLVDDCSPESELIDILRDNVDNQQIYLIQHHENKGFPGAVNSGIRAWPGYDVILLNSDTLVAKGWIESLRKAAYSQIDIGTVTPFSNDASIFSYPYYDQENPVPSIKEVKSLMRLMQKVNAGVVVQAPTAHGFCMYIRHDCLKQTGLLRENLFAQGYGEENDFCMRAQHLGWRHVVAADVFVGHKGGVSFQRSKNALLRRNIKILNDLYPGYDQMVKTYMDRDFLRNYRRNLDIQRLQNFYKAKKKQGIVYRYALIITHAYGGGVERAVQERIYKLRLKGMIPILIRPTILGDGCQLEIQFKSETILYNEITELYPNLVFSLPCEYSILLQFLQKMDIQSLEVHHFSNHHDAVRQLLYDLSIPYHVYIHDYMVFCPRISLLNADKRYCGEPKQLSKCQACVDLMPASRENLIDMDSWIQRSQNELMHAQRVITPSKDTAARIKKHFPMLKKIDVEELEDDRPDLTIEQLAFFSQHTDKIPETEIQKDIYTHSYKVCLIGAIGIEKGFDILKALVADADQRDLPLEFVLVGRTVDDQLFLNSNRLFITGSYKEEEAVDLVNRQQADIAFFPAIWPETWCYALSIAWRAGLKTVAFDLGAIAQRIKTTQRGWVISPELSIIDQNNILLDFCKKARYEKLKVVYK
ncbi:glycosyltransferase [Commensalibacter oyaizuii]|uniref:Glycosyltransferase n=1 Tax=Commensalibacter oyaizuii TaxID=3043873 RepID=A0ABT6Q3U0_9PROT|nr:glycosyltransferase [Commensalibacter sp. TBRC 16381]MDI2091772.1 glycosyltransferase [Commensalibacter sp. TBRC 16381]